MIVDLSTQDGYDIACAMRGPDDQVESYELKVLFTSTIRMLVGSPSFGFLGIERDRIAEGISKRSKKPFPTGTGHYLQHIVDALVALERKHDRTLIQTDVVCLRNLAAKLMAGLEVSKKEVIQGIPKPLSSASEQEWNTSNTSNS